MAPSISIVTKCEPCMEWHLDQALQAGARDDETGAQMQAKLEAGSILQANSIEELAGKMKVPVATCQAKIARYNKRNH